MAIMDRFTGVAKQAAERLSTHRGAVERGIDKAGAFADSKTGGKYGEQIRKGSDQLRSGLDKLENKPEDGGTDPTPGNGSPPSSERRPGTPDGEAGTGGPVRSPN